MYERFHSKITNFHSTTNNIKQKHSDLYWSLELAFTQYLNFPTAVQLNMTRVYLGQKVFLYTSEGARKS